MSIAQAEASGAMCLLAWRKMSKPLISFGFT
jgi:hypothetical protein